ncbi:MAG TPA: YihY/virulence factor BrkB family protein [Flavisolibacter sp.]|nr:YihY/virulence factor BrkB family protein [Flavisolibacter sp.]
MKKFSLKLVWTALKDAFKGFSDDKITKLSASLAYYTVFSLGPLLIVIIYLCSFFLGREAVEGSLYSQIQGFIGADAAKQIQEMIKNAWISDKGGLAAVIGVVTLLVGATTVFGEIQDSINGIWGLKASPKAGIMKLIVSRVLSFGLIATLGFLLLVSLAVTAVVEGIGSRLKTAFPDIGVVVFYIINLVLTLGITTLLFGIIFKVLPDAKIRWKAIWPGAIATSILFMIGKFAISFYISKSEVGSTYGAAGSLVILLVWIYYSSIILYFGAEFTKAYALERGARIIPSEYAEWDKEPVVPGSKPKEPDPSSLEKNRRKEAKHMPRPAVEKHESSRPKKEKKKSAGVGTVLLGLALYYFNTSKKRPAHK